MNHAYNVDKLHFSHSLTSLFFPSSVQKGHNVILLQNPPPSLHHRHRPPHHPLLLRPLPRRPLPAKIHRHRLPSLHRRLALHRPRPLALRPRNLPLHAAARLAFTPYVLVRHVVFLWENPFCWGGCVGWMAYCVGVEGEGDGVGEGVEVC